MNTRSIAGILIWGGLISASGLLLAGCGASEPVASTPGPSVAALQDATGRVTAVPAATSSTAVALTRSGFYVRGWA